MAGPHQRGYDLGVARRPPSLLVRILRTVLIVFGPLLLSIGAVDAIPSLPESLGNGLLRVSGLWLLSVLMITPALLSANSDSEPGPPGSDGGGGPVEPPSEPGPPGGGIPLPDAEQARDRVRDHVRPERRRLWPRRAAREPNHEPSRTLSGR